MVEGWLMVDWFTLVAVLVLLWRILIVEKSLHERVDDIDHSLAVVVQGIVEKIEHLANRVPEINMINQNPLAMILEFMQKRGNLPPHNFPDRNLNSQGGFINRDSTPRGQDGQFIEVEELKTNASQKEKENKTP